MVAQVQDRALIFSDDPADVAPRAVIMLAGEQTLGCNTLQWAAGMVSNKLRLEVAPVHVVLRTTN